MLIFFEGNEGTGKTTVAGLVSKETGWPVIHPADYRELANNNWREDFVVASVVSKIIKPEDGVIFDRSIISGLAYNDESDLDYQTILTQYFSLFSKHQAILCHLWANEETRNQRKHLRDNEYKLKHSIDSLLYIVPSINIIHYCTHYLSAEHVSQSILRAIKRAK